MEKHELDHLESRTKELRQHLRSLADDKSLEEFMFIIRKPGFTSVAEALLFRGAVDGLLAHVQAVNGLKNVIVSAAAKVELNPQPLPPKPEGARGAGAD
jgi:hypothetical protein